MRRIPFDRRYVVATAAYALLLLFIGQRPAGQIPHLEPLLGIGADKIGHFCMYGVLGALMWRAQVCPGTRRQATARPALLAIAFVAMVGSADEIAQGLAHRGRSSDFRDLIADTLGASVAVGVLPAVLLKRP